MTWTHVSKGLKLRFYKNGTEGYFLVARIKDWPIYQIGQIVRDETSGWRVIDLGRYDAPEPTFSSIKAAKEYCIYWLRKHPGEIGVNQIIPLVLLLAFLNVSAAGEFQYRCTILDVAQVTADGTFGSGHASMWKGQDFVISRDTGAVVGGPFQTIRDGREMQQCTPDVDMCIDTRVKARGSKNSSFNSIVSWNHGYHNAFIQIESWEESPKKRFAAFAESDWALYGGLCE